MKTIRVFLRIILVVLAFFLFSCEGIQEKSVERIPPGFVKLSTAGDNLDIGGLHYTIGESQISFFDADEVCIYKTELANDDFIVTYEKNCYVNEKKYSSLVEQAITIAQQRDWISNGTVYLRARGNITYTIMLFDVVTGMEADGKILCELLFAKSVSGDCVEGYETDFMKQIFDHVETNKGTIIDDFTIVNGDIQVKIPAGEELGIVVVKSPDYPGCVRKISGSGRGKSLITYPPMN